MRYQIRIAGKIFEGSNLKMLLRRAVEARRASLKPSTHIGSRVLYDRSRVGA